jgi:hypothetical protein
MKSLITILCCQLSLMLVAGQDDESSCLFHNISKGETLGSDCEKWCSPYSYASFDWAAPSEDDAKIIDRNTVCRCLDASNASVGECLDVETGVWDKSAGVKDCEEYNITSGTTCKEFCLDIDPLAFKFSGSGSNVECSCASNPFIKICEKSGSARTSHPGFVSFGSAILLAAALVSSVFVLA